jgi:hypothetical protein
MSQSRRKRSRLKLSAAEYKKLCTKILQRDGYKCRCCKSRQNLTVHHVVFRSQGGDDAPWNLLTLCNECHHEGVHDRYLIIRGKDGGEVVNADEGVKFLYVNGWRPKRR